MKIGMTIPKPVLAESHCAAIGFVLPNSFGNTLHIASMNKMIVTSGTHFFRFFEAPIV